MAKIELSLPGRLITAANKALKNAVSAEGGIRNAFTALKAAKPKGVSFDDFKAAVNGMLNKFDRKTQRKAYDVKKQQLARAWKVVLGGKKTKATTKRKPPVAKFLAGKYTLKQLERAVALKRAALASAAK